jgi:8-oxo-dGTP pyrophosphatase MutT (NUDIX family)
MTDWHLAHFAQHLPDGDYSELLTPTGADWRTRVIIPMQDGIVALYVEKESYWYLPGGQTEPVETLPACAIRETEEETHLQVRPERLLYVREYLDTLEFYILAHHAGGQLQVGHDPEPDAPPIDDVGILSFDRLENDSDLTFYPVTVRQRLRHDMQAPPTSAIYIGDMP